MDCWGWRLEAALLLLVSEGGGGGRVGMAALRFERLFSGGGMSLTFLLSLERLCPNRGIFLSLNDKNQKGC